MQSWRSILHKGLLVRVVVSHLVTKTVASIVQARLVRRYLEHVVAEVAEAAIVARATGMVRTGCALVKRGHIDLLELTGEALGGGLHATGHKDLTVC